MIGAISGVNVNYGSYIYGRYAGVSAAGASERVKGAQGVTALSAHRAAQPELPVEPVRPVTAVKPGAAGDLNLGALLQKQASDPAEMAVRMRIQYGVPDEQQTQGVRLPGNNVKLPGSSAAADANAVKPSSSDSAAGAEGVQKAAEEGRCETCEKRKYQDGSDDPGVSFQTPTRLTPGQAASAVRGHEQEHVVREQAKARREDRRVVSQSVTLHTDICPECGRVYISGGVTKTVTAASPKEPAAEEAAEESEENTGFSGLDIVA